jgi:hypothetical protein
MGFIEINTKWITPIYEQIKESITKAIELGLLKKGDKVPSILYQPHTGGKKVKHLYVV